MDEPIFDLQGVNVYYDGPRAVADVDLEIEPNQITALIGPSGAGKTSLLRTLNRMSELMPSVTVTGRVLYNGANLYDPGVDPVEVRRKIGMVFQEPNPFPTMSVYENVAAGLTLNQRGVRQAEKDAIVERSLRSAHVWDEVKDRLQKPGSALSGGQQQRLCIARALAVNPDAILMDEPCSALDPLATARVEETMLALKENVSIVVVTHNLQQAGRVADMTAFLSVALEGSESSEGHRVGRLIEYDKTEKLFTQPADKRTEDYVTGKFG